MACRDVKQQNKQYILPVTDNAFTIKNVSPLGNENYLHQRRCMQSTIDLDSDSMMVSVLVSILLTTKLLVVSEWRVKGNTHRGLQYIVKRGIRNSCLSLIMPPQQNARILLHTDRSVAAESFIQKYAITNTGLNYIR